MQDLSVTLVQTETVWHDPGANLLNIEALLGSPSASKTDVIVLPEMFTTGFTMSSSEIAETMQGETIKWMTRIAAKYNAALCGSIVIKEDANYYNRFIWAAPDGAVLYYDKRHLFRMANEHNYYTSGSENLTIEFRGWKIRPAVCYDLRFPVWARNKMEHSEFEYDLLIYVANWPEARITAWDTLLKARAIENHAYCVGVNRTGSDSNGVEYNGHSAACDPKGNTLLPESTEVCVKTCVLEYDSLQHYRNQFPAQLDADNFKIID